MIKLYIELSLIILCRCECRVSNSCFIPFLTVKMVLFPVFSPLCGVHDTRGHWQTCLQTEWQLNLCQHFLRVLNFNVLLHIQSLPFSQDYWDKFWNVCSRQKWIVEKNIARNWETAELFWMWRISEALFKRGKWICIIPCGLCNKWWKSEKVQHVLGQ